MPRLKITPRNISIEIKVVSKRTIPGLEKYALLNNYQDEKVLHQA